MIQFNLIEYLQILGVLFAGLIAIIELYHRILKPKYEKEIKIKSKLYCKVEELINSAKKFSIPNELEKEGKISWQTFYQINQLPQNIEKKLKVLEKKFEEFCNWLRASRAFVGNIIMEYTYTTCKELADEFEKLGRGWLGPNLIYALTIPIFRKKEITSSWFIDTNPELCENLMKCKGFQRIRSLFSKLNEVTEDPILENMRKARGEFLQNADEFKKKLKV